MRFYDRKSELLELAELFKQTSESARMTVITGRRRVGKTLLSIEFAHKHKFIYLFVAKKSESMLCEEFIEEIKKQFSIPVYGEIKHFSDVFSILIEVSRKKRIIIIIDEFQEFLNINPAVYSEIQHLWDLNKNKCKMHLIMIGSVYSLMNNIFQNAKEPLFGRADRQIYIKQFGIATIREILVDHDYDDVKILFDYYVFTGGIPRYIDLLIANKAFSWEAIVDYMIQANSPFLLEGKNLLIEEFGREYGTYFSILELIARGKTSRPEMESVLETNIGGHLGRLEKDYSLITRYKPVNAKPDTRTQKYKIVDNFLNFWFRFIYKNSATIEAGNFQYIKELIRRDYSTYAGEILERFFMELLAATGKYNIIGTYWEKGNQNQIDIVASNDLAKTITFAEVKLNKARIRLETLKQKSQRLLLEYPGYAPEWLELSLEDVKKYLCNFN
jgi:AAA+ ATPase superfamily predicted ATPase